MTLLARKVHLAGSSTPPSASALHHPTLVPKFLALTTMPVKLLSSYILSTSVSALTKPNTTKFSLRLPLWGLTASLSLETNQQRTLRMKTNHQKTLRMKTIAKRKKSTSTR